jgi:hypothetical protein
MTHEAKSVEMEWTDLESDEERTEREAVARVCVCGHARSKHKRVTGRLKCVIDGCACGPGCIHEGLVAADGTVLPDDVIDRCANHYGKQER